MITHKTYAIILRQILQARHVWFECVIHEMKTEKLQNETKTIFFNKLKKRMTELQYKNQVCVLITC